MPEIHVYDVCTRAFVCRRGAHFKVHTTSPVSLSLFRSIHISSFYDTSYIE